jgi:hypothetical protein
MPTKFTWAALRDPGRHDPRPINFHPDPAAVARREAREAAGRKLWEEQYHQDARATQDRRPGQEGAWIHWFEFTVKPKAKEIEARIAACQTDEERQQLAVELFEELHRPDNGFIRGGGATMSKAIDASETIKGFLIDAIVINNNATPRRLG